MNLELTKRWITRWEGARPVVYDDATGKPLTAEAHPIGNPTIGVGLNLKSAAARAAISALGLDYAAALAGAVSLTADQIDRLLVGSINVALVTARALAPNFDQIPDNQQMVLVDLAFNMGAPRLSAFKETLAAVRSQQWPDAAAALRDSAWFNQVGPARHQRGGADVAVLGNTASPADILNG